MPSEYLFVKALPSASMTAKEVKFSDAMSSIPRHWRRFSFSIRSWISGSTVTSGVLPHSLTGSIIGNVEMNLNEERKKERKSGMRMRMRMEMSVSVVFKKEEKRVTKR